MFVSASFGLDEQLLYSLAGNVPGGVSEQWFFGQYSNDWFFIPSPQDGYFVDHTGGHRNSGRHRVARTSVERVGHDHDDRAYCPSHEMRVFQSAQVPFGWSRHAHT
jgi:hypothetical protein